MPRQAGTAVTNNFAGGLVTESTSLNFPENACTSIENCVIDIKGNIHRRLGFGLEGNATTRNINRSDSVISTYLWKNVGGSGDLNLLVVQVGSTLYFYYATASATLSTGQIANTVNLTSFSPSGAPSPSTKACQYAAGLGKLFVTHPNLNSFTITFNKDTETFTTTQIYLTIRDLEGVEDTLDVSARPTTLSNTHNYNLLNQGWPPNTNVEISGVSISYNETTVNTPYDWPVTNANTKYTIGETLWAYVSGDLSRAYSGTVSSTSSTHVRIHVLSNTGGATQTITRWYISRNPPHLFIWNSNTSTWPSNADVWWAFKDSKDAFNWSLIANTPVSTRYAPKGRYVLNLYNQNRNAVSGLTGLPNFTTGYERASTCAFFAGRVFYAGINYPGVNSKIYFSQIIETADQYGKCYQKNDPTSESFYDILPTDGGVIDIPDAGTIVKLFAMKDGLIVFATNGVWYITGSTGLGFTATDFTVMKISEIFTTSATSFVNAQGVPFWWNNDGIWTLGTGEGGSMQAQSLTDQKIRDFYGEIPVSSRKNAKGYFNPLTKTLQWIYRSTEATTIAESQEYDRVLIFDMRLGSFYTWTIGDSVTKVHDLGVVESTGGSATINQVVRGADTVVSASGDLVVVYDISPGITQPVFKYLVSTPTGSLGAFTFAETKNTDYTDWPNNANIDYISEFTTGYKIRGEAQKKFQSNYVYIFSDAGEDTEFYFQGIRNFALSGDTGKFGSRQLVTNNRVNYKTDWKRLKVRGHGLALQFKVQSMPGKPFNILGWSEFITGNQNI